jgi:hypothetical protein
MAKKRCRRVKSGPRKGRCRLKKRAKSTKRAKSKRRASSVCRTGYQLVQHNPGTGTRYKRPRCAAMTKRGKVKTHAPRKLKAIKASKIVVVR